MKIPFSRIIVTAFSFIFLIACSESSSPFIDDDESPKPDPNKKEFKLNQYAENKKGSIYDLMTFSVYSDQKHTLRDVMETYDSLTWSIPELGERHLIKTGSFTWQWSHCFILPGKYTATLRGYKNDKIILEDAIEVDIEHQKDFLMYNWQDLKELSLGGSIGYANSFEKTTFWEHKTWTHREGDKLAVMLGFSQKDGDELLLDEQKEYLNQYISKLYGKPQYTEENMEELNQTYNQLFIPKSETDVPAKIWLTTKNKIVLLKSDKNDWYKNYHIQAEPRNQ